MEAFSYGIGKGLREPCSPYREANYFGASLNEPSADGWNCLPVIVQQTSSFDLSAISKGQEVVVALLNIQDTPEGRLYFKAEWYRNRDNALLFTLPWMYDAEEGGWAYFYAFLGYVDWEINENGGYRVEFTVSGELSYKKIIQLTISGIPVEEEVKEIERGAMGWISERFTAASGFFYAAYLEALDWVYPFWLISDFFYALSQVCSDLSWDFYYFSLWVENISGRIIRILSWDIIWSYIISYVPNLVEIRDWFYNWYSTVFQLVNNWWTATMVEVLGWIDAAKDWTWLWIEYLQGQVDELRVRLDNLILELPDLTELLAGLSDLIDSAFEIRSSFWEGWQDWRDKVTEFFTDPEDWLYKSFDRIIERFW